METNSTHVDQFVRLRSKHNDWLVSPDLRPRLIADAEEAETNMTEIAIRILAATFKVPYEPGGRKSSPTPDNSVIVLTLPDNLAKAIGAAANARVPSRTKASEIRHALCAHYGLAVPAPVKRPRAPRRKATA